MLEQLGRVQPFRPYGDESYSMSYFVTRSTVELWPHPRAQPVLADNGVDVWRCDLDAPERARDAPDRWLSADEARRAARLRHREDRRRFAAARAALRGILAGYLNCPPAEIRFVYGDNGKPMLVPESTTAADLHFNLSHSAACVLVAVSCGYSVGVDVEQVRPLRNARALAERVFSPAERAAWRALPEQERLSAFFACWTRKEAWIKANGGGIFQAPQSFTVSVDPAETAPRLLSITNADVLAEQWEMRTLHPAAGYVAALAVQGPIELLRRWTWPPAPEARSG